MRNPGFRIIPLALSFIITAAVCLRGDELPAKLTPGTKLSSLVIGQTTYSNVTIRSVSPRSAMISHEGGMKSLLLRDLPADLQQRFGYNPEADRAEDAKVKAAQSAAENKQKERIAAARTTRANAENKDTKIDDVIRTFGQPPTIKEAVDFRPKLRDYGLWVKDQGARASCSVFAIVSAIEYENAELTGKPERFSEEYLIWATAKTLGHSGSQAPEVTDDPRQLDMGFTLQEVVTAVRSYGTLPRGRMPNRMAGTIPEPSAELQNEARTAHRVTVHAIPGHDGGSVLANAIHALNAGYPVPIGIRWVKGRHTWRTGFLDKQTPDEDSGHAVTLVGYKCETGKIEDTVFTFKNSWGANWGVDGYGYATYYFLSQNLHAAALLEITTN
ncbi:MAG: C1 family peptidase [Nibricoccus sp.]